MVKHTGKITSQARVYSRAFASKAEALRYERRSIKAWKPALNVRYNDWWQYDLIG
jgi:excinuclease UvrABC nuclease subunit